MKRLLVLKVIAMAAVLAVVTVSLPRPASAADEPLGFNDFLIAAQPMLEALTSEGGGATAERAQALIDFLDENQPDPCYVTIWLDLYSLGQVGGMVFANPTDADAYLPAFGLIADRFHTDLDDSLTACFE